MSSFNPVSTSGKTLFPPLHQNHYDYLNRFPSYSDAADMGKNIANPMSPIRTSYLPLANPTFSVEWLGESDKIAKAMGIKRNLTENWNTYCRRILDDDNFEVYDKLKTECEEVFEIESEIKNSVDTFMGKLVSEKTLNADTITQFKGLHEVLIPHIQKLRTLQPLLDGLGIDTTKIFAELGSSINIIDAKIKEKETPTDVTSATELFSLYVVKSCIGELTTEDKIAIKSFLPLLKLEENTINLFLRGTNSAENFVAIQSMEQFIRDTITEQHIVDVNGNFLKFKTVASFEKLIQLYVTIESYGSEEQKQFIRNNLKLRDTIIDTIDANLEIQELFGKTDSVAIDLYAMKNSIRARVKNIFFISTKDVDDFFTSSTFTSLVFYNATETNLFTVAFKKYERMLKATCKFILARDYNPEGYASEQDVLDTYYETPSVERLIKWVKQKSFMLSSPNSFPNWPSYFENIYSRGWLLTQSFGEMKWVACKVLEEIKGSTLSSCAIQEFQQNKRIATKMMSSFNEIVLNVKQDSRFPTLASELLSSIDTYVVKFNEFKEKPLNIPEELKNDLTAIEEFTQTLISFRYEHIQPNELGMEIILNIIENSKEKMPSEYNSEIKYSISQMKELMRKSYTGKTISISLHDEISNIISVTEIYQAIWEMKVKTPLTQESAENLNVQGLYKLTTVNLEDNIWEETLIKLREGQTDIA